VAVSAGVDTTWFAEEFPGMGAALGLALQALGLAKVEMSLLPEALLAERRAAARRVLFSAAAAAILATVGYLYLDAKGAGKEVDNFIAEMKKTIENVAKQQEQVDKEGAKVRPRADQLRRWMAIGAERGQYSEVLEKLLKVVDGYNGKLAAAQPPASLKKGDAYVDYRQGEIILAGFYMSRDNPQVAMASKPELEFPLTDRDLLQQFGNLKEATPMYVAAKFECRGVDVNHVVNFEKLLMGVPGFKTIKSKPTDKWMVGEGEKRQRLAHYDWGRKLEDRERDKENALVFWEVWQYSPGADSVAADAGEKSAG
jgi:hypothetical protein